MRNATNLATELSATRLLVQPTIAMRERHILPYLAYVIVEVRTHLYDFAGSPLDRHIAYVAKSLQVSRNAKAEIERASLGSVVPTTIRGAQPGRIGSPRATSVHSL